MKSIEIKCVNSNSDSEFPLGTTLAEIARVLRIQTNEPILGAYVNHRPKPLDYDLVKPRVVEFIDLCPNIF